MINKMIKLDRYAIIVFLSVILGLFRYYSYDNNDFNLFSLIDKNKKEIEVNLDLIDVVRKNTENYEISYEEAYFYYENKLAVFVDARNQDEITKEGQILNSLIIPVTDIKLVIEGRRNDEGECVDYGSMNFVSEDICGYPDVFDLEFDLDSLKVEDANLDFPEELKTINNLKKIDKKIPYVIYCGSKDCDKSENLAFYMKRDYFNFQYISIYKGGWKEWSQSE